MGESLLGGSLLYNFVAGFHQGLPRRCSPVGLGPGHPSVGEAHLGGCLVSYYQGMKTKVPHVLIVVLAYDSHVLNTESQSFLHPK